MGFMAYSLASGLALYFLISNIFTICQYAALGTLHWENLKFWEKKPAPKPAVKQRQAASAVKKAETAEALPEKAETKSESKAKASSASKSSEDDNVFTQKIDYREFKNHKKPKKK